MQKKQLTSTTVCAKSFNFRKSIAKFRLVMMAERLCIPISHWCAVDFRRGDHNVESSFHFFWQIFSLELSCKPYKIHVTDI